MPQCSCIVHHGGAGTTAASVRSGRPTIITPVFTDHFDFAKQVSVLGVGIGLDQLSRVTVEQLSAAVNRSVTDETIIRTARGSARGCAPRMAFLPPSAS